MPRCPRDAGGVAQIQSTSEASSQAPRPPNCCISPAVQTVTPPKTSLCSPSAASLLPLATKGTASVYSPVDTATEGGPGGNRCWEKPVLHAWEMGCDSTSGLGSAPQSKGWRKKACLHGSPRSQGEALQDTDPAQRQGSSPRSALCLPSPSSIPRTSRDKRSPGAVGDPLQDGQKPFAWTHLLSNPPLVPSPGWQFPGPAPPGTPNDRQMDRHTDTHKGLGG